MARPSSRFALFALVHASLVLGVAGCSCAASHERDVDAGPQPDARTGADAGPSSCSGTAPFHDCTYCGGDVFFDPTCSGGVWTCPSGTERADRCPPTCWGPPPGPDCRCNTSASPPRWECTATSCGPTTEPGSACSVEGERCGECCATSWGPFSCFGGTWQLEPCPLDCPVPDPTPCPASPRLGGMCPVEGQLCGDACCDTAVLCERGVWTPGPVADCLTCSSYACGPGSCRSDQACAMLGCPGDEQCLPMPFDCRSCDCLELPPFATCEERDGHVYVVGGDCA